MSKPGLYQTILNAEEARREAEAPQPDEPSYIVPTSCWRPIEGTGIPADAQMYPPGCPDADWCRGNRLCYWNCKRDGEEEW